MLYLDEILNTTPQDNISMTFKYTSVSYINTYCCVQSLCTWFNYQIIDIPHCGQQCYQYVLFFFLFKYLFVHRSPNSWYRFYSINLLFEHLPYIYIYMYIYILLKSSLWWTCFLISSSSNCFLIILIWSCLILSWKTHCICL